LEILSSRMKAASHGIPADPNAIISLAEEAYTAAPSPGSRGIMMQALMFRGSDRMAKADPGFSRLRDRFARVEPPQVLVASILSVDGPLKDLTLKDPDVGRAIDLVRESYAACPTHATGPRSWALLRARYPDAAASMAKRYLADESDRLEDEIIARLHPYDSTVNLTAYWAARMQKKDDEGRKILAEARSRGVPIPIEAP
jgi:hypothetical protein